MGLIRNIMDDIPDGSAVTVDSAPIIYYLEDHPQFADQFAPLFDAVAVGRVRIVISTITLAEVLSGPFGVDNEALAVQYRHVLCRSAGWQVIPVTEDVAVTASRLRSRYKLRLPDAIQVAGQILAKRYDEQRFLIVISDGWPYGYDDMPAALRESIATVQKKGIIIIGIGVETEKMESLFRLSSPVYNQKDLIKEFSRIYTDASATALET